MTINEILKVWNHFYQTGLIFIQRKENYNTEYVASIIYTFTLNKYFEQVEWGDQFSTIDISHTQLTNVKNKNEMSKEVIVRQLYLS